MPPELGVIIVAAGRGARLGGALKQYRELGGIPMLLRAIRPFASHPGVRCIAVVLPSDDAAAPPPWLASLVGERLVVTPGGADRAASVVAGLRALPADCTGVLVHDGARPFPDPAVVAQVADAVTRGESAIAAVPLTDTLKESDADGRAIVRTVPRERLWRAQTPQGFPRAVLEAAYRQSNGSVAPPTDDASLVEALGVRIRLIPDSPRNMKITTAGDLALADLWARHPA